MNTVLIVDDSKTSRYMLRHILVENGYEVMESKRLSRSKNMTRKPK